MGWSLNITLVPNECVLSALRFVVLFPFLSAILISSMLSAKTKQADYPLIDHMIVP